MEFSEIEKKWQKKWEEKDVFRTELDSKKKKFYCLEMFPYPSGEGLHMGHALNYTIGDIYARFKRMLGFNVLYPMGYDSFGLPAENAAIKANKHPREFTQNAISNYIKQQKALGLSYDWRRKISTSSPKYYRWNQFFFLKLLEKDLIYRKKAPVNWCGECNTVLANEQVHNGKCWRHEDTDIEVKHLEQWFIKTTKYADELLDCIDDLKWPNRIKTMQKNWIGKSRGTEIDFEIKDNSNYVLLHGFTGSPKNDFFPYLKEELEKREFSVSIPQLPNTNNPDILKQVEYVLANEKFNENTVLLGHSLGSVVALKVLEKVKKPIKKLILAAGFSKSGFNDKKRPFEDTFNWEFDFEKIKKNVKEIIILRDKTDKIVPKERAETLQKKLGGKIIDFNAEEQHICGKKEPVVLENCLNKFPIFTTRPDTIYGVTFMVISAQHYKLMELVTQNQKKEVEEFLKKIKSVSQKEMESLEKQGVFTGSYAINPVTKEKIPIWAGNFVLADYGSGMVMAVPAHDQRDYEFAKKYGIEIKGVVRKKTARYFIIEKSLPKDKVKELSAFGEIKIEKDFGDWGKGFGVYVNIEDEEKLINFLKENLLEKSKEAKGWYANSEELAIFRNKVIHTSSSEGIDGFIKYGEKLGIPKGQLDLDVNCFTGNGILYNSDKFNGINNNDAKEKITKYLEEKKLGKKTIQYKLKDWLVSRQRYWGTPIPVVYCDKCGIVPEKNLPIILPDDVKFGEGNPLLTSKEFVETKCPKCDSDAKRETDTMDTFFDSSWYYLRYCDNENDTEAFSRESSKYFMPVNQYIGGAEHACMHLLYSRFFIKALRDLGFVDFNEPFLSLFNQGMLHAKDGRKMSKSLGNVINPLDIVEKYSADCLRLTLMSFASPNSNTNWDEKVLIGSHKFLNKVFDKFKEIKIGNADEKIISKLNKTISDVTKLIENFKYNLAIIKIRELFNSLPDETSKEVLEKSLKLFHPICPHITEELWEKLGNKDFISIEKWPECDSSKINEDIEKQELAVDKLVNDINNITRIIKERGEKFEKVYVYALPNEKDVYFAEINEIRKRTNMKVNIFAVNDKEKYDPQNKSKKAKPNKPAIYVE
jgi:leucyl-tRNA synthetase